MATIPAKSTTAMYKISMIIYGQSVAQREGACSALEIRAELFLFENENAMLDEVVPVLYLS